MRYISTRGGATAKGFVDVLLAGLAEDGGLFMPAEWPRLHAAEIAALAGKPYADGAFTIQRLDNAIKLLANAPEDLDQDL